MATVIQLGEEEFFLFQQIAKALEELVKLLTELVKVQASQG